MWSLVADQCPKWFIVLVKQIVEADFALGQRIFKDVSDLLGDLLRSANKLAVVDLNAAIDDKLHQPFADPKDVVRAVFGNTQSLLAGL